MAPRIEEWLMRMAEPACWLEWQGTRLPLAPGGALTFGRSAGCDVVLPEEDTLVSRRAGAVRCYDDHLEVVNTSTTRELRLRPPVGGDVLIRPSSSATSRGMPVFRILVSGRFESTYAIGCRGPREVAPLSEDDGGDTTVVRPFPLSATERKMLRELCRPMLVLSGDVAGPATYAAIGIAIGGSDRYARKVLKDVRDRLTAHGVPGLAPAGPAAAADFRRPLCEFAIANGWAFEE